jgi:hypothetical protein
VLSVVTVRVVACVPDRLLACLNPVTEEDPVAVTVRVRPPGHQRRAIVHDPVTIVVHRVADLRRSRTDEGVTVVAVSPRRDQVQRGLTQPFRAVAVAVCVQPAAARRVVPVHRAIAVIVDPVAQLLCPRMNCGVVILAIAKQPTHTVVVTVHATGQHQ